jgi:hypothetical protein
MNASRAALMVIGVNLVAVWAAAAAGGRVAVTEPVAPPQAAADEAVGEARATLLAAAERLEAHARREGVRPAMLRDPFRFGAEARPAGRRAIGVAEPAPPAAAEAPDAAPPAEPEPDIALQGMAESGEGEALVRTAILRAGSELVLASLGAKVGDRFEVTGLTADSVEMEDLVAHVRRTWRLK